MVPITSSGTFHWLTPTNGDSPTCPLSGVEFILPKARVLNKFFLACLTLANTFFFFFNSLRVQEKLDNRKNSIFGKDWEINNCDNVQDEDRLGIRSLKLKAAPESLFDIKVEMTALDFYSVPFLGPARCVNRVGCYPFALGYCGMDLGEESTTNAQRMLVKIKERRLEAERNEMMPQEIATKLTL